MGRRARLLIASLLVLLASPGAALAVPIVYTVSGQIRFGDSLVEDFTGTFVLADPTFLFFDPNDSRGVQMDRYAISDFTIASASYTVSQTGSSALFVFWGQHQDTGEYLLNGVDSGMFGTTSAGTMDTSFGFLDRSAYIGGPGLQPETFTGRTVDILSSPFPEGTHHPRALNNIVAVSTGRVARIPEPSTLLVTGMGLLAAIGLRHRRRAA